MDYLIGSTYNGFKLLKKYNVDEIDSEVMLFEHEFSGARLMNVSNDDDNKVFSIGFRTPPSDDSGAAHIVEHCVLSGSRKYTTKEPFMDMIKGSMNTFINAMTFSDKTLYPVASKNTKDFYNLMDVYLDAVLHPRIYEIEDIFMQEGWHYDIHAKDEDVIYKGVVYNEMKGAYSNPLSLFRDQIAASLYPDTCYKYSSGGDPDHITDLTHEEFLNFHKKFYHPSNSYIYLYGDGNVNELLNYIDTNYLSDFEREETNSEILPQTPITTSVNSHRVYPISDDDDTDGKDYLAISFNLGETTDTEINLMSQVLSEMLIESSASPLKKALLESDIAKDILSPGNDGLYRAFSIVAKDTSMSRKDEFISIVKNSLRDMVTNGIDKKLILSSINVVEYSLREAENFATKGIIYNINSLDSWLYDGDEAAPLRYNETLAKLRAGVETGYFENFINEKILNNPHQSICAMTPKKGVLDEQKSRDSMKLAEYKASLSEDELNELIVKNTALKTKQLSVDSPEDLASIPKLTREDVSDETHEIDSSIVYDDKYKILYNNVFTNSISYMNLVFDMSHIKTEDIYYVSMLSDLIGELSTSENSYEDLSNLVLLNTGGISLSPTVYTKYKNNTDYYPKLVLNSKAIGTSTKEMISLVAEIISKTKFDDVKRIKDVLSQVKSQTEMAILGSGNAVATNRLSSYYSESASYDEKIGGMDYYWFLSDTLNSFDDNSASIISNLNRVYCELFNVNDLVISFTGDAGEFDYFKSQLKPLLKVLPSSRLKAAKHNFDKIKLNEGIASSSNVQFVGKGANFTELGYTYHGSMFVMSTILNSEYLHDNVRAKGGAYGCGLSINNNGNLTVASYRDPNLADTFDVYDNIPTFLDKFDLSDEDVFKFVIGAVSKIDSAKTPSTLGKIALVDYITGRTLEDKKKMRSEILNTKSSDIRSHSKMITDVMAANYRCVLGNDQIINDNSEAFSNVVKLNK